MKYKSILVPLQTVALLLIASFFQFALAQTPCAGCSGFPDKDANSGRFITVTVHEATLGDTGPGQKVFNVSLQVAPTIAVGSSFEVGIFDGDVGGFWDTFAPPTPDQLNYFIFVDPNRVGNQTGTDLLAAANGGVPVTSANTPDNAWKLFNITQNAGAFNAATGQFFYHFVAIWNTLNNANEQNLFKVSVQGVPFLLAGSTIGFLGTDNSVNSTTIPIPGSPTYDGTFNFLFAIPGPGTATSFTLWDGDADFSGDTDDPNTEPCTPQLPNTCNSIPFQVSPLTVPEGANGGIANPPTPTIMYTVTGPGGFSVTNNDPSGGQEWERFKVGLNNVPFDATDVDVQVASIPNGVYTWAWKNVGVFNNIFIHSDFDIFVCPSDAPVCQPPKVPPPPSICTTLSPGFWKNHPDAWPVDSIVVGNKTYNKAQAISIMALPKGGDSKLILFFQLVAAKLNALSGTPTSCITSTLLAADAFFVAHPIDPNNPTANPFKSNSAEALGNILDGYNNDNASPCGVKLCP